MHYFGEKMHKTKVFLHKSEKIGCCFVKDSLYAASIAIGFM